MRKGLAVGSTAGRSFRSGEVSSSGPPCGSKLNQASAVLNGRRRPSWPKNRRRKLRSLSASMAAHEAVLNHIGGASGSCPCSCASHFCLTVLCFFFLAAAPLSPDSSVVVRLGRTAELRFFDDGLGVAAAQRTGCPLTARWGLTACARLCLDGRGSRRG